MRLLVALVVAIGALTVACHPRSDYVHECPSPGSVEHHLVYRVRDYRASNGLPDLYCNAFAQAHGEGHAGNMRDQNRLYHSNTGDGYPDGYECWSGENVGVVDWPSNVSGSSAADTIFFAWVNSPGHRALMLEDAAEWIGVGATAGGSPRKMWVALEMGTPHDSSRCGLA